MTQLQLFQTTASPAVVKLDPRTKILLVLVINMALISGTADGTAVYARSAFAAIPFLLLLSGGRRKTAGLYAVLYAAAQYSELFLINAGIGAANMVIAMLAGMMLRFVPGTMMGYYFISSTRVSEFIASMERMRLTSKIVIPLSVMFRFFPTIVEEYRSIRDAMRMRGIGLRSLGQNPVVLLEYRMVPLMISVVKIGNELSAAALTRGLGSPVKRSNICRVGFGLWDAILITAVLAALTAYIIF